MRANPTFRNLSFRERESDAAGFVDSRVEVGGALDSPLIKSFAVRWYGLSGCLWGALVRTPSPLKEGAMRLDLEQNRGRHVSSREIALNLILSAAHHFINCNDPIEARTLGPAFATVGRIEISFRSWSGSFVFPETFRLVRKSWPQPPNGIDIWIPKEKGLNAKKVLNAEWYDDGTLIVCTFCRGEWETVILRAVASLSGTNSMELGRCEIRTLH